MLGKTPAFTASIPIRWGDMDAFGHVNNTVYFRYMEQARIEWLAQLRQPQMSDPDGPVLVNASCNFLQQLRYPGMVEVAIYVGAVGRSSVETAYEIRRSDQPAAMYAEGAAKIVWINFAEKKSTPLPDRIRQLLLTGQEGAAL